MKFLYLLPKITTKDVVKLLETDNLELDIKTTVFSFMNGNNVAIEELKKWNNGYKSFIN